MTMPNNRADNGSKGINLGFKEDRMWQYREWRYGWGHPYYVQDIDQVEYRFYPKTDVLCPVMYFECTRYDPRPGMNFPSSASSSYLSQIRTRYFKRDGQGDFALRMAHLLHIPVHVILFPHDMKQVWMWDLTDKPWVHMTDWEYKTFIKKIPFPDWYIDEQEQAIIDEQILKEAIASDTY